jgi:cytochrome c-type biogenesis protein CcmH
MNRRATRWIVAAVAVAIAAAAFPAPAVASGRAQLSDIEDEVMCPICGTALGLSQSPQADRERAFIRGLIAQGKTKEQIEDALVAQYGPDVLATPSGHGFDLAAWIVPVFGFAVAGIALLVGVRRWRRRGGGDGDGEQAAIAPADAERLESDLARYDL